MKICLAGILTSLRETVSWIMKDDMWTTLDMKPNKGVGRGPQAAGRPGLKADNQFLSMVVKMAVGYSMHVDFNKTERTNKLSSTLLTQNWLEWLRLMKTIKLIWLLHSLERWLIDVVPLTALNDKVLQEICWDFGPQFQYCRRSGWTENDIKKLRL